MLNWISKNFKTDNIFNYFSNIYKSNDKIRNKEMKYTKEPVYERVKCSNIDKDIRLPKTQIKIEKEDPKMIKLTEKQKLVMGNYINKSLYEYHKGNIHLDDEIINIFKNLQTSISEDLNINKYCVDFVLADMKKSYDKYGTVVEMNYTDLDDIFY